MSESDRGVVGGSYLVRLWREPGGEHESLPPPRVYVRDLRSGEERYLKSVESLAEFFGRLIRPRLEEPTENSRPAG